MSCSCADFVRSSLGLCKHQLAALDAPEQEHALKSAAMPAPWTSRSPGSRIILRGRTILDGLFAPELSAFRALVERITVEDRQQMVVFSQWRRMLRLAQWSVRDLLGAAGMRAVFFTGAESARLREQALVDFHDSLECAVMFLSAAGGVGMNLQRAASCSINLELPWNPASARAAHRPHSTRPPSGGVRTEAAPALAAPLAE
jgi:SNF2 family DNA or RNA helicase